MMSDATQEQSASLTQVVGRTVMANEEQAIRLDLDSTRRNFDGDANLIRDIGFIFIEDVPLLIQPGHPADAIAGRRVPRIGGSGGSPPLGS